MKHRNTTCCQNIISAAGVLAHIPSGTWTRHDYETLDFPLGDPEAQKKWIDEISAKFNPQRQQWFDAVQGPADPSTPEGKKHLAHLQEQTLASAENRALIQECLRTGNKARWKELEHNAKKTPQRAQTEEDQQNSLKNDPLVRGLSNATGADFGEYMQGAPGGSLLIISPERPREWNLKLTGADGGGGRAVEDFRLKFY